MIVSKTPGVTRWARVRAQRSQPAACLRGRLSGRRSSQDSERGRALLSLSVYIARK
jgi:hypothetical protein